MERIVCTAHKRLAHILDEAARGEAGNLVTRTLCSVVAEISVLVYGGCFDFVTLLLPIRGFSAGATSLERIWRTRPRVFHFPCQLACSD